MSISTLQHNSATIECDIFTLTWEIYGIAFRTFAHNPCGIIRLPKPRRSRRSTGQRGQAGCTHDIWLPSHSNTMSSLLTTEQLEELGRCMLSIIQARYAMMAVYCLQVYEWLATCVFRFFCHLKWPRPGRLHAYNDMLILGQRRKSVWCVFSPGGCISCAAINQLTVKIDSSRPLDLCESRVSSMPILSPLRLAFGVLGVCRQP